MLKNYKVITVTHRQTNLKEIGQYVVSNTDGFEVAEQLRAIQENLQIEELLYLSTCNRVLYFLYTPQVLESYWIKDFLYQVNPHLSISEEDIEDNVVIAEGASAIQHLFEVAASVDSMVIGEREILRQLREAYRQSKDWGLTGDNIRLAMRFAVESAKGVYSQTRIGEKPVSIVSLAVKKMLETKLQTSDRIVMIGAGQTNMLVAKFLKKHGFSNVTVFNRTFRRAQQLATVVGGTALPWDELPQFDKGFDALIVCTGATAAVVNEDLYAKLLANESAQKVVLDLSIPNNVAKAVVDRFDIHYVEIEDLRILSDKNKAFRLKEISKVKQLLELRLDEFELVFQQRKIERAMRHIPAEIKAVKERAINEVFKKQLANLDENALQVVREMMDYMERRCVGIPMQAAKNTVS